MADARHDEVERKFDIDASTALPDLSDLYEVSPGTIHDLEAVYYDTEDLLLTRSAITLRERSGGSDDGWHAKFPKARDTRTELWHKAGSVQGDMPAEVHDWVIPVVGQRSLHPIAVLRTQRHEHTLRRPGAGTVAYVCDDRVNSSRLHGPSWANEWREWEVELACNERAILDHLSARLLTAGAQRAATQSKLVRALGNLAPVPPKVSDN